MPPQVEILTRCCRVWLDPDLDDLDPQAVRLAEAVLKCGLAQMPKDPYLIILSSSLYVHPLLLATSLLRFL